MIDLYMFPTANGLRAAVALEESGLPYRAHRVNLPKGETKSPDFLKINPLGQVPVIVDESGPEGRPLTLTQSNAILIYVAEKSGRFMPSDPLRRLRMWERFAFALTDAGSANNAANQAIRSMKEKHQPTIDYFTDRLFEEFATCDRFLADTPYLAGEITIADLSLYPIYARAKVLMNRPEAFAALPNLERWGAALAERPGVQRGMKVGAA